MRTIKYCGLLVVLLYFLSCHTSDNKEQKAAHKGQMFVKVQPFQTATGWGYCIFADNKLYIRQAYIPNYPGNHSFITKEDALKIGNLAVQKMAAYHKMPYISPDDLQHLHIQLPR